MLEHFSGIEDPRPLHRVAYPLSEVLLTTGKHDAAMDTVADQRYGGSYDAAYPQRMVGRGAVRRDATQPHVAANVERPRRFFQQR
jgi:hypothetical protein